MKPRLIQTGKIGDENKAEKEILNLLRELPNITRFIVNCESTALMRIACMVWKKPVPISLSWRRTLA